MTWDVLFRVEGAEDVVRLDVLFRVEGAGDVLRLVASSKHSAANVHQGERIFLGLKAAV